MRERHFISKRRQSPYKKHVHKERTDITYHAEHYHIITAMSASRENRSTLKSDIVRSGSTQNQYKSAITIFNNFLVDVLGSVSINYMKIDDLEDKVENILMGYYLYNRYTKIPNNHQACLADHNKDPTGYLKYTNIA